MKLKALAFAIGVAGVTLPAFATADQPALSAGKAIVDAATAIRTGNDAASLDNPGRTKGTTAEPSGTAVPEPQTYMLMLAGLGVVGLLLSRRRLH